MKRALLGILGLLWPLTAAAQLPPRLTVIIQPSARSAPIETRSNLEDALREGGATIVPPGRLAPGVLTAPAGVRTLAHRLGVDGVVELRLQRHTSTAQVRVLAADGSVRLTNELSLPGRRLSRTEAKSVATVVVGAITAPKAAETLPPPPPAPVPPENLIEDSQPPRNEATTPTPPQAPLSFVPAPRTDTRRVLDFWAAGTGSWRSAEAGATTSATALRFGTDAPYPGLAVGFETEPFLRPSLSWLGFDISDAFSYVRVTSPNLPPGTTGENAIENSFLLNVIGQPPLPPAAGVLSLRLGVAFEGFVVNNVPPLVSATHLGPRAVVDYERNIFDRIAVDLGGGVRPFGLVGADLPALYGPTSSSLGVEAHGGLSGPLDRIFARLRWAVAYEFLRYDDHFGAGKTTTFFGETYQRFVVGLVYLP